MDGMVLRDYLSAMDGGDPAKVLELLEPDFSFLIALPGREVTGRSKEDFAAYITGRAAVDRVHHVLRYAADGDVEMVYGRVADGGATTGWFHSAAVVSTTGRMARYQSFFSTTFELV
jgi:ketosteroid isomerase-like protein